MFRTWNSNKFLLNGMINYYNTEQTISLQKYIIYIIKLNAPRLHHTSNISKKSYINNELIDLFVNNNDKFYNILDKIKTSNIDIILYKFLKIICKEYNY